MTPGGFNDRDLEEVQHTPPEQENAWMVTFTDLVSLMLTFFIMIFAMSSVKEDKWKEVTDSLSRSFNPVALDTLGVFSRFNIGATFQKRAADLKYLTSILKEAAARDPQLRKARFILSNDKLVIVLPNSMLFQSGRAAITGKARQAVFDLGGMLRNIDNQISVNGHTDPSPMAGSRYSSNWELSLARATAVANALRWSGYTKEITAHGYSDSRFERLPGWLSEAERFNLARRVDIVIMATAEND